MRDRRRERAAAQAEPAHQPDADAARRVVALDHGELGEVAGGVGDDPAVAHRRPVLRGDRDQLSRDDLDHAHPLGRGSEVEGVAAERRGMHAVAHPSGHGRRVERERPPVARGDRAAGDHDRGAERLEVLEQRHVRVEPRRDRAELVEPVAARRVQRRHQPARPRARSPRPRPGGTSRRCGPRARACRARGRRCRTRSTRGRGAGRARAARSGCARWRPRAAAPRDRGGASRAPPPRSSTRGRSGCRRPRRRRARGR